MKNSVIQFLDSAAEKWNNNIAFKSGNEKISFSDYQEKALRIGSFLCQHKNYSFRSPIAVYLPKSINSLLAFMGILYSGNFYCPIPYRSPIDRAVRIIEISKAAFIITDYSNIETVKNFGVDDNKILVIEKMIQHDIDNKKISSIVSQVIDTDPAYVLFTSGSTGLPKGVVVPHRAVIDYLEWVTEEFDIDSSFVFANQAPFHFDASMPDIFMPIFSGCCVYLISEHLFMLPGRLVEELNKHEVNSLIWVPSALMVLSNNNTFQKKRINNLRVCMFCGEVMPNKQLNIWRKYYPNTVYVNLYGPTEAAYACTYYVIDRLFEDSDPLPLGKPCRNTDIILLSDNERRIIELNTVGEICIRGSSLALGYYSQLKNSAFTNDPTHSNYPEIIYRTGDLGYYNENNELMFSGRKDHQIKHMGYRIELGEIETAISSLNSIRRVACLYDSISSEIVAFIECDNDVDRDYIVKGVSNLIPSYMMPNRIKIFDRMPMNMNGKIDRTHLQSIIQSVEGEYYE